MNVKEKQKALLNKLIEVHKKAIESGVTEVQIAQALGIPVIAINEKVLDLSHMPGTISKKR